MALPGGTPNGAARRAEILDCAEELFRTRGVRGTSMAEIARRVGLTSPALYYYFRSRSDVLRACVDRCALRLQGELRRAAETPGPPWPRLRAMVEAKYDTLAALERNASDQHFAELAGEIRGLAARHCAPHISVEIDIFRRVLGEGIAAGVFRPVSAEEGVRLIFSIIRGFSVFCEMPGSFAEASSSRASSSREAVLDFVAHALLAEPERSSGSAGE